MVRIINIDTKTRTIRVSNGKDDLEWFTTDTGSHVPLKKGQSKAEAIKEHFGDGRSSGKKRLDELNKKYGTNKGYLIQSDKPLDKKKDGIIKEYEDFGKATPEVSLTETGSGFHERTKQPAKKKETSQEELKIKRNRGEISDQEYARKSKQKISRDDVADKSAGTGEILDQMLMIGGITQQERYRMDKMMEHHDIKPDDLIKVLESGEYSPEQVLYTVLGYDEEPVLHMLDLAKKTERPAKQEPEEKAHRIATNLFSAINTSQFTDAQLKSMISSFIYDEADNLDDDGVVTKDELNSEEFKRLKKFVDEKLNVPAKKETPDTSNADYFKSTMQETMKKFPRLYEHEQKHLEEYAVSAFSALRNNPGKEKAIVDEILDSYNQHVKRLGMWVDTPTLAKKAFVEKLAEAYK